MIVFFLTYNLQTNDEQKVKVVSLLACFLHRFQIRLQILGMFPAQLVPEIVKNTHQPITIIIYLIMLGMQAHIPSIWVKAHRILKVFRIFVEVSNPQNHFPILWNFVTCRKSHFKSQLAQLNLKLLLGHTRFN